MSEIKSFVCPNCGANTTNTTNCEYCGSLLVRFVEKGIDLSQTVYLNNDKVLPGLIKHLERNLAIQKKEIAITDISWIDQNGDKPTISVLTQSNAAWSDRRDIEISDANDGLIIALSFDYYADSSTESQQINRLAKYQEQKFKKLPSFELFTPHNSIIYDDDVECQITVHEYAIYFGHDAEGAARIISEILVEVMDIKLDDSSIEIHTDTADAITQYREKSNQAWDEEHDDTFKIFGIEWYLAVIYAAVGFLLGKILLNLF